MTVSVKLNTDSTIWTDFKEGRDYALSYIYNQHVDFLFFYGKKMTADEELILDVIHDVFCYLIEKKESLGEPQNIRMYLLKSFRRKLLLEIEKANKQESNKVTVQEPNIVFSIEEEIIKSEEHSERELSIKEGLKKLNSKQREALYYKFNCGFDYELICDLMSVSKSSARQLVSRGIAVVKSHVQEQGFHLLFFLKRNCF
ncbi:sigma-70 family RNA polymerase sigma factor [Puteibacter caeruleilacunae]|nr:sigma-70 family RNA polymerase sigma factor [Puteibacter caeruleilacunae]